MRKGTGLLTAVTILAIMIMGCSTSGSDTTFAAPSGISFGKINMSAWQYDEENDFYWQTGISYCEKPADADYETMGFFVPGAFFNSYANGNGTYTCTINKTAQVAGYTAATAPMIIPVNTPGYAAMAAPVDNLSSCGYGSISDFTSAGFVLVFAGARGRDAGAPSGVVDFKAAIRYARYNSDVLPGNPDRFFSLGMSGGGAQSALLGTTGNSDLYTPYLEEIGAVKGVSDAVMGSMCWCPITNLDVADSAYEWNMGSARSGLDEDTQKLSDGLAAAFAEYINNIRLTDSNGNVLFLVESEDGILQSGTYYDYIKAVIEESLNNFLSDTEFPYDADISSSGGFGGRLDGILGGLEGDRTIGYEAFDGIGRNNAAGGIAISGIYETVQDYIDALNADRVWVNYNSLSNTASITSVADFVKAMKVPSKAVGAFDALDRSQGENTLFGYGDGNGAHFDRIEAALLAGTDYEAAFTGDLTRLDALGNTVDYRMDMYNPMYFLCSYYEGKGSSQVAPYFRIRTGLSQGDTAVCTEVNLALALASCGCNVDFATVWGVGHKEAERTGSSLANFIEWVNSCVE